MRLDRSFLLSFYLSLAMAGACLGYVSLATHPAEVLLLAGPVMLLLLTAYFLEGRWCLNAFWSTVVGLGLAASAGVWFAGFFVRRSGHDSESANVLVVMMPHIAFWLVLLTLAKLFRPKSPGDVWALHLMAFSGVALAASQDSDFLLSFLLLGYLVCMLWSLACFYLYREDLFAWRSRQPKGNASAPANSPALPWRWLGLLLAVRRAAVILAVVVLFYLLTPRHAVSSWEENLFRSASLQSGLGDSVIDLNRTGTIHTSKAIAFVVKAETADGNPKLDLDPVQRWRGLVLNNYEHGRWSHLSVRGTPSGQPGEESDVLPDFGSQQYFLDFHFAMRLHRLPVVAQPADLHPDRDVPVVFFLHNQSKSGRRYPDGELGGPRNIHDLGEHCNSYRQVCAPVPDPSLSLPISREIDIGRMYCRLPPLSGLSPWVRTVLSTLVEQGRLSLDDLRRDRQGRLLSQYHEKVARALEEYLATSGKYTYTLNLPRKDRTVDPIVDFLCNVKQGHCERFASGLAVMLRSQGIPARVIAGFRGAEHQGKGVYHVRQSNAHAWVEALIERPGLNGPERRWQTLDPTPSEENETESLSGLGRWWREFSNRGGSMWRNYVVDYTADQQDAMLGDFFSRFSLRSLFTDRTGWLALLALVLLGVPLLFILFRAYRHRKDAGKEVERTGGYVAFYAAWLAMLDRRCNIEPHRGQTAQEFARDLAERLRKLPSAPGLGDVPSMMANLYYRVRFAAVPLTEAEQQKVEADIRQFDLALTSIAPPLRNLSATTR
jgi:protein-glutamine gamma-glutamyltransferase